MSDQEKYEMARRAQIVRRYISRENPPMGDRYLLLLEVVYPSERFRELVREEREEVAV